MRGAARIAFGELAATALLVVVASLSGLARSEVGATSVQGALVGSMAFGLGFALLVSSFAPLSKAHVNPLISIIASLGGEQSCVETAGRVCAQALGAILATAAIRLAPTLAAATVESRPFADGVAAFAFALVSVGVAPARDLRIPAALGTFATASYWMTGRATLGNPILAASFACASHAGVADAACGIAACAAGSGLGTVIALVLFPGARTALRWLTFAPPTPRILS